MVGALVAAPARLATAENMPPMLGTHLCTPPPPVQSPVDLPALRSSQGGVSVQGTYQVV